MICAIVKMSLSSATKQKLGKDTLEFSFPGELPIPRKNEIINYYNICGVVKNVLYRFGVGEEPKVEIIAGEQCLY